MKYYEAGVDHAFEAAEERSKAAIAARDQRIKMLESAA